MPETQFTRYYEIPNTLPCPLESWSSNDNLVEKSKYVNQKGVKKVHTTTVDRDQIQVSGRANRRTKKESLGNINLAASTKMVQLQYVFKTVKR